MILCELYSIGIRTRWPEIYTFTEEQPGRGWGWGLGWVCACHSKLNLNPIVNSNSNSNRDGMEWKCVTGLCCVFYTRFIIEPIRGLVRAGGRWWVAAGQLGNRVTRLDTLSIQCRLKRPLFLANELRCLFVSMANSLLSTHTHVSSEGGQRGEGVCVPECVWEILKHWQRD